jgi:uncharacterized protein (TIGR00725 family)
MDRVVSVIGESLSSMETYSMGERVGELLAENGITVVCGGLTGVMEAVCKGAKRKGGRTVGILPGTDRHSGNAYIDVPIVSTIGYARNVIVARTGQVVIAIGGWFGTLCEMAFALDAGIPVIGLKTWAIAKDGKTPEKGIIPASTPEEAVTLALHYLEVPHEK